MTSLSTRFLGQPRLTNPILVPRFINTMTFVTSATALSSRSNDDAIPVYIVEEERQRNRCRPAATLRADGGCGQSLCPSSSPMSLTSPPPRSLTWPRKTHQQTFIIFTKRGTRSHEGAIISGSSYSDRVLAGIMHRFSLQSGVGARRDRQDCKDSGMWETPAGRMISSLQ